MNASFFFLAGEGRARGEGSGREVPILLVLVGEPRLEQTIKLIILCLFLLRKAPVRSTSFPGSLLARPRAGKMSDPGNEVVRSRYTPRQSDLKTQLLAHRALKSNAKTSAFRKRSSNRRSLNTPALRFRVDGKNFESRTYQKQ